MKSYILTLLGLFFFSTGVNAAVGCRIGNYILTSPNGMYYMNGMDKLPIYNYSPGSANTIAKRNWDQDPQCGILRTVAEGYSNASGTKNNQSAKCSPANNTADVGQLVNYNPADNSCIKNVPLDDNLWIILSVVGVLGFYFLLKKRLLTV